jgi:hypothetical protein
VWYCWYTSVVMVVCQPGRQCSDVDAEGNVTRWTCPSIRTAINCVYAPFHGRYIYDALCYITRRRFDRSLQDIVSDGKEMPMHFFLGRHTKKQHDYCVYA